MLTDSTSGVLVAALGGILTLLAILLCRHARVAGFAHTKLLWILCLVGIAALGISLVATTLHLDASPTGRFYLGMLTGIGLGSLASSITLYVVEAWMTGRPTGSR